MGTRLTWGPFNSAVVDQNVESVGNNVFEGRRFAIVLIRGVRRLDSARGASVQA